MARNRESQPLNPSLLDRLIDDEPERTREPPKGQHQLLRDLKLSVRRDLENLLNSRQRCRSWPDDLTDLEQSLMNYGTPDFAGINSGVLEEREKLRLTIERVIRQFEPRFKSVRVTLLENTDTMDRTLRFRIDAMLRLEPSPEPVVFDSQLEPSTASFTVKSHAS